MGRLGKPLWLEAGWGAQIEQQRKRGPARLFTGSWGVGIASRSQSTILTSAALPSDGKRRMHASLLQVRSAITIGDVQSDALDGQQRQRVLGGKDQ